MKRNLFLAVTFSVAAVTFYNVSTPANTKYDLLVGDIEALSQDESSSDKGAPMSFTCGALIGYDKKGKPIYCQTTVVTCQGTGTHCERRPCNLHG